MYDVDEAHMKFMNKALATEDGTAAYTRDFVDSFHDIDSYLDVIGRDKVAELSNSTTSFLLDPYRRWILTPEQVAALQVNEVAA
jgi:glutaconate CoA-transferase subunit A